MQNDLSAKIFRTITVAAVIFIGLTIGTKSAWAYTNLIANPGAETGNFSGWTKVDGGSGWGISGLAHSGSYGFTSSYEWGTLSQTLDLVGSGYAASTLDAQPTIDFSTWVAGFDSFSGTNDPYSVTVTLQDASHNPITTYATGDQTASGSWANITHSFSSYGTGVRYVYVELRGKDSSWWLGQYGATFDDTSLTLATETTPPTISSLTPADNSGGLPIANNLSLTFNEIVSVGTGNLVIYRSSDNTAIATINVTSGQVTGSGTTTITVNPTADLVSSTTYYVQFPATAFHDTAANNFAGIADTTTWNFITKGHSYIAPTIANDYTINNLTATQSSDATVELNWQNGTNVNYTQAFVSTDAGQTWTAISDFLTSNDCIWQISPDYLGHDASFKVTATDLSNTLGSAISTTLTLATTSADQAASSQPATATDSAPTIDQITTNTSPYDGSTEQITPVTADSYIRAKNYDTVYYLDTNLTRHPFINEQIFFTWQDSFNVINNVSDATLATLPLGTPMLPKAGVILVKIQSDSHVSAITSNSLNQAVIRPINDETTAIDLFGTNWADYVIDLPPTLYAHFTTSSALTSHDTITLTNFKTRLALSAN